MATPETTIVSLMSVPLKKGGTDTPLFYVKSYQTTAFDSVIIENGVFTALSYVRIDGLHGIVKLPCKIDLALQANYCRIINSAHENEIIYAFIDKVTYQSDIRTDIEFTVDTMQTYFYDIDYGTAFIERVHSRTDEPGDNLLPEPIELGEPVYYNRKNLLLNTDFQYILIVIKSSLWSASVPQQLSGIIIENGRAFCGSYGIIRDIIRDNNITGDNILAYYPVPAIVAPITNTSNIITGANKPTRDLASGVTARSDKFGNYTVRNKKLLTAPYSYLMADNGNGESLVMPYEYFEDPTKCTAQLECSILPPLVIRLTPLGFRGLEYSSATIVRGDFNYTLTLKDYPQNIVNADVFHRYVTQNMASIAASVGTSAIKAAILPTAGTVTGLAGNIISQAAKLVDAKNTPDIVKSTPQFNNISYMNNEQDFYISRVGMREQYLMMADDFFDMYGYNYQRTGDILRTVELNRRYWCYIKVSEANVRPKYNASYKPVGFSPSTEILNDINERLQRGVRFWKIGSTQAVGWVSWFQNYANVNEVI